MNRKELIFPVIILSATVLGTAVLVWKGNELADYIQVDVFKLLAQLLLITGIGGIITLAITEFTRAREKRQQVKDLQRNAFSDLVESYNEVKQIRRQLRAKAVRREPDNTKLIVDRDMYDSLLTRLNDIQLQWEFYIRYAKANKDVYGTAEPTFTDELDIAQRFIGKVISEWEDELKTFSGEPPAKSLSDLTKLNNFIDKASNGFKPYVASPIGSTLMSLAEVIAK